MVFSSLLFIFIFLPILLLVYFLVPSKCKNVVLLLGSLCFYAWGEPIYVLLMILEVLFNYVMGIDIDRTRCNTKLCKRNLIFTLVVDLSLLFYFKYMGFVCSIVHLPYQELALPIGISFYTFQTLSYVVDIYRGDAKVQKNVLNFALYITMFPQLVAGPIVRYVDIEEQLTHRRFSIHQFGTGVERFIRGLGKKVLLANNIGALATNIQGMPTDSRSIATVWIGAIAYTFQIYFDFSGYSDMAIGLGKMFGFDFMKNFDHPYLSKSVTGFWRRWHISLGNWFREYLYIPLGGNRVSTAKHIRNILIVWMATGFWHGASWNFICWGLYYGLLLLAEKYIWGIKLNKLPSILRNIYTMFWVVIGWVLFMSSDLSAAATYIGNMFGVGACGIMDQTAMYFLRSYGMLFVLCILCSGFLARRVFKKMVLSWPKVGFGMSAVILFSSMAYLVYDTYNPFLYFRF